VFHGGVGMEFFQQGFLVDVVETGFQIGIEYKLCFEPNAIEDRIDSIMS
jgi:hypothetical protein